MSYLNSISSFFERRKRTLGFIVGGIGSIYLVGKYAIRKMSEMAEISSKASADKENLEKRFNLNLQDCQFTIQALLPTISTQLLSSMDVEGLSSKLAIAAAKLREAECARIEAEDLAKRLAEQELRAEEEKRLMVERGETDDDPPEEGIELEVPPVDLQAPSSPGLNPSASVFVPSFGTPSSAATPSSTEIKIIETTLPIPVIDQDITASVNDLAAEIITPTLSAGSNSIGIESNDISPSAPVELEEQDPVLSKSWAQVVVNGTGDVTELIQSTSALPEAVEEKIEIVAEPSRAQIWHEIKILSFTRTISCIYILTLLTLQTHVQLNLLGRGNYVNSVISSIPANSATSLSNRSNSPTLIIENEETDETNGEESNYQDSEEKFKLDSEMERMYLTFSWWLLHEGWKLIAERVQFAVEEVVGVMALKSIITFGDLSGLLGKIRAKIDFNDDGTAYDFSTALFPTTPSTEFQTLSSGGLPPSSYSNGLPPPLRQLLNETFDFLDCTDCSTVRKICLDKLFEKFGEGCESSFKSVNGGEEAGGRFEDVTERSVRLAGLLPNVARLSHLILNGIPNEFVEVLEEVRELNEFSAIIFSSFDKENLRS